MDAKRAGRTDPVLIHGTLRFTGQPEKSYEYRKHAAGCSRAIDCVRLLDAITFDVVNGKEVPLLHFPDGSRIHLAPWEDAGQRARPDRCADAMVA